jgi:hypothetical protein
MRNTLVVARAIDKFARFGKMKFWDRRKRRYVRICTDMYGYVRFVYGRVRRRRYDFDRKGLLVYGYVRLCTVCVRLCTAVRVRFRLKCLSVHRKALCCAAAQRAVKIASDGGQQSQNLAVGWVWSQLSKASRPRAACRQFSSPATYPCVSQPVGTVEIWYMRQCRICIGHANLRALSRKAVRRECVRRESNRGEVASTKLQPWQKQKRRNRANRGPYPRR